MSKRKDELQESYKIVLSDAMRERLDNSQSTTGTQALDKEKVARFTKDFLIELLTHSQLNPLPTSTEETVIRRIKVGSIDAAAKIIHLNDKDRVSSLLHHAIKAKSANIISNELFDEVFEQCKDPQAAAVGTKHPLIDDMNGTALIWVALNDALSGHEPYPFWQLLKNPMIGVEQLWNRDTTHQQTVLNYLCNDFGLRGNKYDGYIKQLIVERDAVLEPRFSWEPKQYSPSMDIATFLEPYYTKWRGECDALLASGAHPRTFSQSDVRHFFSLNRISELLLGGHDASLPELEKTLDHIRSQLPTWAREQVEIDAREATAILMRETPDATIHPAAHWGTLATKKSQGAI